MRVIILADGSAKRWTLSTPKHLISVNGEVLLHRTVRQLIERGETDIWITSHDDRYCVPGTIRFEPSDNRFQIDQFYACSSLWLGCVNKPVVFLYGDVYFSDKAIDVILSSIVNDHLYFQRTRASKITGKEWKEGFGAKVQDTVMFHNALSLLRQDLVAGKIVDHHHQLQGFLEGFGTGDWFSIGPHGVEIDDETEDFDFPEDIQVWNTHVAEARSLGMIK
jgi:hypothetical protein